MLLCFVLFYTVVNTFTIVTCTSLYGIPARGNFLWLLFVFRLIEIIFVFYFNKKKLFYPIFKTVFVLCFTSFYHEYYTFLMSWTGNPVCKRKKKCWQFSLCCNWKTTVGRVFNLDLIVKFVCNSVIIVLILSSTPDLDIIMLIS